MIQHFSFTFVPFFDFAMQFFSTPVMSSNLRTKLHYLRRSAFYRIPIFYVYFISTKPTALSSCVTVTSQVAY